MSGARTAALENSTVPPAWGNRRRAHEVEFLPAALEVLETPASPGGRWLALAISAFFALALAWASLGKVEIVAVAEGKVVPSGRTKVIQPLEAGVVAAIAVEEGQHVHAGDLLVELDATSTGADRQAIAADLMQTRLTVARRRSVLGLAGGELLDEPAADIDPEAARLARDLRVRQLAEQEAKVAALDREIEKETAALVGAEAEITTLRASLPLMTERVEGRRQLMEKGLTPKMQFLELQQMLIEMRGNLAAAKARAVETAAGLAGLEQSRTRIQEEFDRDRVRELIEAEGRMETLIQDLAKAEQRDRERRIAAPVDGTVQQLAIHTIGGVVSPAQELMVIVPDDSDLEIEAMILNKDVGFVEEGQAASIKLEAFPFTRYGTLDGNVATISRDAVQDERRGLLFTARIVVPDAKLQVDGEVLPLLPGMLASVEIKTGSRTLMEYVLSPVMKVTDEAGRER